VVNVLRVTLIALVLLLCACDDSESTPSTPSPSENDATVVPVTPVEKPDDVPESARPVTENEVLGQVIREPDTTPDGVRTRRIEELVCAERIMTLRTDEETIYAAIACDGVPQGDQLELFLLQEAGIQLEVSDERSRILIETINGSQAEFTVAGIWVE
jgi:hypothetical protein